MDELIGIVINCCWIREIVIIIFSRHQVHACRKVLTGMCLTVNSMRPLKIVSLIFIISRFSRAAECPCILIGNVKMAGYNDT